MRDTVELQLALTPPWTVCRTHFDPEARRLCDAADCPVYDAEQKTWCPLNFFQHQSCLIARVPRVRRTLAARPSTSHGRGLTAASACCLKQCRWDDPGHAGRRREPANMAPGCGGCASLRRSGACAGGCVERHPHCHRRFAYIQAPHLRRGRLLGTASCAGLVARYTRRGTTRRNKTTSAFEDMESFVQSTKEHGIILLHIPKTAGTSIEKTISGWVGLDRAALHIELLNRDDRNKMDTKRFISGHLFFDEIQQLPFRRNLKLAISVREPYARLASALRMLDRFSLPGNELQCANMPKFVEEASTIFSKVAFERPEELAAYFKNMNAWGRLSFDNCQTRFLLPAPAVDYDGSLEHSNEQIGEVSDNDLQVVCANLSSVGFICVTEHLGESLARIAPEFNQQMTSWVIRANTADSPEWKVARPLDYTNPRIRAIMASLVNQHLKTV
jgi:hypothetical protein